MQFTLFSFLLLISCTLQKSLGGVVKIIFPNKQLGIINLCWPQILFSAIIQNLIKKSDKVSREMLNSRIAHTKIALSCESPLHDCICGVYYIILQLLKLLKFSVNNLPVTITGLWQMIQCCAALPNHTGLLHSQTPHSLAVSQTAQKSGSELFLTLPFLGCGHSSFFLFYFLNNLQTETPFFHIQTPQILSGRGKTPA